MLNRLNRDGSFRRRRAENPRQQWKVWISGRILPRNNRMEEFLLKICEPSLNFDKTSDKMT